MNKDWVRAMQELRRSNAAQPIPGKRLADQQDKDEWFYCPDLCHHHNCRNEDDAPDVDSDKMGTGGETGDTE